MDRADRHRLDEVDLLRFWLPQDESMTSVGVDVQLPRVEHLEAVVRRATVEVYQGLRLRVATRDDLVLLKIGAWKPIDRADAIELAAISRLPRWIGAFWSTKPACVGGSTDLRRFVRA